MTARIGLFHATLNAVAPAVEAWRETRRPVDLRHYVDEGLLDHVRRNGLDHDAVARLRHWLELIASDGAAAIMTTCSSLSPALPPLRAQVSRPVIGIDDAMIDDAVARGTRIGIVATLATAAETTRSLFAARPEAADLTLTTRVPDRAFEALARGEHDTHDRAIQAAAAALAPGVDVIVLAQLSMSRALPMLAGLPAPVLTSGPGAVARTLAAAASARAIPV